MSYKLSDIIWGNVVANKETGKIDSRLALVPGSFIKAIRDIEGEVLDRYNIPKHIADHMLEIACAGEFFRLVTYAAMIKCVYEVLRS